MATQNPIESEGTPLPEAQVDRFMLKVVVGYPESDDELTVVQRSLADGRGLQILDLDEPRFARRFEGSMSIPRSRATRCGSRLRRATPSRSASST